MYVCVLLCDDNPDCLVWYSERDHISLDYGQKIKFLAFYKQEKLGPYCPEKDLDTGYFDVVGSDRRYVCCSCDDVIAMDSI